MQFTVTQTEITKAFLAPNWEQGCRYPTGPATTLIRNLDAHPGLI